MLSVDKLLLFASGGCQKPGCKHAHEKGRLFLHPKCHPHDGTWTSVDPVTSTLRVECITCKKLVVEVQLKEGV
jgi:hypothetical protein